MKRFLDLLFPPRVDELAVRQATEDDVSSRVSPRLSPATRPGTVTLLSFSDPMVASLMHEAKYHGNRRAITLLGGVLAEYLRDLDEDVRAGTLIPIPLGKLRRKTRGFNQTEEVARCALGVLGAEGMSRIVLHANILSRVRETVSQVSLPRAEREANMRGAFGAAHVLYPETTYIIIDDVLTTGATLQAGIDALTAAGAKHIIPIALSH